jgi:hypothetical protein
VSRVEEIDEGGIWEAGRGKEKVKGLVGLWDVLLVVTEVRLICMLIDALLMTCRPRRCLSTAFTQTSLRRSSSRS